MVATVLAARLPKPGQRAVVLQGTVGYSFRAADTLWDINQKWRAFLAARPGLREQIVTRLREHLANGDFTRENFTAMVDGLLSVGRSRDGVEYIDRFFKSFVGDERESTIATIREVARLSEQEDKDPNRQLVYKTLSCAEVTPELRVLEGQVDPETLEIVIVDREPCSTYTSQVPGYDSRAYQIPWPIVYLQGETDTATPLEHARYHFDGQTKSASKTFVLVPGGSHGLLEGEGYRCAPQFWQALLPDFTSVVATLVPCAK